MARRQRDPLAGCRRLLIDGSNQRGQSAEPLPEDVLVGSWSRLFPASVGLVAVFDNDPLIGAGTKRLIGRVPVIHARAGGGDDAIIAVLRQRPEGTVVVTDDADLRRRVTELGGRVEHDDWLRNRREHDRLVASSVGRRVIGPPDARRRHG